MQGRISAVILDLDGTLVHTAPDFHVAINAMRAEFGMAPLSVETISGLIGKGAEFLVRNSLEIEAGGAPAPEACDAMDAFFRNYSAVNGQHASLYPEVTEGLRAMRDHGLRLACVTNKPSGFAMDLLRMKRLDSYFEFVFGGDAFARKKPDPLPLQEACTRFGLPQNRVLVIGDSSNDATAARAAGCPVLLVPYGYNHGHAAAETDCDGVVNTLLQAAHVAAAWQGPIDSKKHVSR
jgi:phosphoglycolate phosphatase